jgi:hypothetical protein
VQTDPAALALIRQRTAAGKKGVSPAKGWFLRPAVAGGALAFTLVLGTLVGVDMAQNDGPQNVVADPPATALAVGQAAGSAEAATSDAADSRMTKNAPAEESAPKLAGTPEEQLAAQDPAAMSKMEMAPQTPVHKIPLDDGRSPYVAITSPDSGATVERTVELKGLARAFEANVIIEVSQNGKVVKRDYATASMGAPEKGEWTKKLSLEPGAYKVEVFEESMKGDGTKLSSDTIWITVADAPDAGSEPSSEGAADPVAIPADGGGTPEDSVTDSAVDPAVDPAATPVDDAS